MPLLATLALAASAAACPSLAGQASDSFTVSITVLPAGPGSCTTTLGPDGQPLVDCRPAVIGVSTGGGGGPRPSTTEALGYRLPDARVKLAGAVVEVGEESFLAWGEYSSRMILAGGVEYLEMRVTW